MIIVISAIGIAIVLGAAWGRFELYTDSLVWGDLDIEPKDKERRRD